MEAWSVGLSLREVLACPGLLTLSSEEDLNFSVLALSSEGDLGVPGEIVSSEGVSGLSVFVLPSAVVVKPTGSFLKLKIGCTKLVATVF